MQCMPTLNQGFKSPCSMNDDNKDFNSIQSLLKTDSERKLLTLYNILQHQTLYLVEMEFKRKHTWSAHLWDIFDLLIFLSGD